MADHTLNLTVELDTAVFPAHSVTDITSTVISVDIDHGVDVDNGACSVKLTAMPGVADFRVRLYVYCSLDGASPVLRFNGFITELVYNADRTVTLSCQDFMSQLRFGWSRDDRTYTNVTAQSVIQNLVEASGIDASLTSIAGNGWVIGVAQDVVLHGGTINVLTGDPGTSDVPLDLIRRIDEATPLYVTYSAGDGAVYRRAWAVGSSVASFSDGSGGNAWDIEVRKTLGETYNACKVTGLTIAGIPLSSLTQVAYTPIIPDPPAYYTRTVNNPLIEDQTQADAVTVAYTDYEQQYFMLYSWTTALNTDVNPADTVTVTAHAKDSTARTMLVRHIHHSITAANAITTISAKY